MTQVDVNKYCKSFQPKVDYCDKVILQVFEEQTIRQWLWNMTENPTSGIVAKVFAFLSASFILISVAGKQIYKLNSYGDRTASVFFNLLQVISKQQKNS